MGFGLYLSIGKRSPWDMVYTCVLVKGHDGVRLYLGIGKGSPWVWSILEYW